MGGARSGAPAADLEFVRAALAARGGSRIPDNFTPTAPGFDPKDPAMQRVRASPVLLVPFVFIRFLLLSAVVSLV